MENQSAYFLFYIKNQCTTLYTRETRDVTMEGLFKHVALQVAENLHTAEIVWYYSVPSIKMDTSMLLTEHYVLMYTASYV